MQRFDTTNKVGLETAVLRWLKDYPADLTCPVQVWYEALGGFGAPTKNDEAAIAAVLDKQPEWKSTGATRYEKYGQQATWTKTAGQSQPKAASAGRFAVQHLFKVGGVYKAPDGKRYKVVLSEVYNLRCFELDKKDNMIGPMVKIDPVGKLAKTLKPA
jgi:hypothetical protein